MRLSLPCLPTYSVEILALCGNPSPKQQIDKGTLVFLRNINRTITILKAAATYTVVPTADFATVWSRSENLRFVRCHRHGQRNVLNRLVGGR